MSNMNSLISFRFTLTSKAYSPTTLNETRRGSVRSNVAVSMALRSDFHVINVSICASVGKKKGADQSWDGECNDQHVSPILHAAAPIWGFF